MTIIDYQIILRWCMLTCTLAFVWSENLLWTLYSKKTTWNSAASFCFERGERLLKLNTQVKMDILYSIRFESGTSIYTCNISILSHIDEDIWIGLYYDADSTECYWQGWCEDEANISAYHWWGSLFRPFSILPCTTINMFTFKWGPSMCNIDRAVVCETDTDDQEACSDHIRYLPEGQKICVKAVSNQWRILPPDENYLFRPKPPPCYIVWSDGSPTEMTKTRSVSPSRTNMYAVSTEKELSTEEITSNSKIVNKTISKSLGTGGFLTLLKELQSFESSSTSQSFGSKLTNDVKTEISTYYKIEPSYDVHTTETNTIETSMHEPCTCHAMETRNITEKELNQKIEELQIILTVKRSETVKSKLKLISANDERSSSKTIGFIGIIIITIPAIILISFDVSNFILFRNR